MLDVYRGRDGAHKVSQVGGAADIIEPVPQRQLVGKGDLVDRLATVEKCLRGLEAVPRSGVVEVVGPQERGDLGKRLRVDQDGADDRFLGV